MTAEFERPPRNIDRYYESVGSGLGRIVGFIVVIALAALLFTTFYGRTPSGPLASCISSMSPAGISWTGVAQFVPCSAHSSAPS